MFDHQIYEQMAWALARLVLFLLAIGLGKLAFRNLRNEIYWFEALGILNLILLLLSGSYIAWSLYEIALISNSFALVGLLVIVVIIRNLVLALTN